MLLVTIGFGSTVSFAVAVPISDAVSNVCTPVASNVLLTGFVMVGGVVSCTVILWVAVAEFPDESVAVQVMVVVVMPNSKDGGMLLVTIGFGSTVSSAVAVPISDAVSSVSSPVASNVLLGGTWVNVGRVVSATFGDIDTLSISTNSDAWLDFATNLRLAELSGISSVSDSSSHSLVSCLLLCVYDASVVHLVSSVEYWMYSPSLPLTLISTNLSNSMVSGDDVSKSDIIVAMHCVSQLFELRTMLPDRVSDDESWGAASIHLTRSINVVCVDSKNCVIVSIMVGGDSIRIVTVPSLLRRWPSSARNVKESMSASTLAYGVYV